MSDVTKTASAAVSEAERAPFFGRVAAVSLAVLVVILVVGGVFVWRTNDAMANLPFLRQGDGAGARGKTLVDDTPWRSAQALTALAVSQEELAYAHRAEHLADHEVDQAFATALRKANLRQRRLTGEALTLQQKVTELEALVAGDQSVLTTVIKGGEDEQIAQAQLGLDQDELSDAKTDLARASGDQRDEIQQELSAREAEMKKFDSSGGTGEVAVIAVKRYRTLAGLVSAWQQQRTRYGLVLQAKSAAERDAAALTAEHDRLEAASGKGAEAAGDRLAGIKRQSLERQLMGLYDDRIATEQQLATVYGDWAAQVMLQHRIVLHLVLVQCMVIGLILLAGIVLNATVKRVTEHKLVDELVTDKRRMRTLSWIVRLVVQVLTLLGVLLVVLGPPNQLSTVVGLVTAGLTVALQDFILAFVGWFILMGRTGIAVGDVVEINSVTGEVVEIGLFRTTLMETGNWTSTGHPTGRRVGFNNKYAISGQYFNFSTAGQWMWDEMTVTLPVGEDVAATMERVRKTVTEETLEDSRTAESEWRKVSRQQGARQFSAKPAVNARPAGAGVELVVRYVTRAAGRFDRRNTLYADVLDSLREKGKG